MLQPLVLARRATRAMSLSALTIVCLSAASCAHKPRAVRYPVPRAALHQSAVPEREHVPAREALLDPNVKRAPRVVIPAPPPLSPPAAVPATPEATSESAAPTGATAGAPVLGNSEAPKAATPAPAAAAPLAGFTPQASPLLAAFDSKPRGQPPRTEPYVEQIERERAARTSALRSWSPLYYPADYYAYPAYPYYGAPAYYARPYRGFGLGMGFGLGLGFGVSRGFGYRGHHHFGFGRHGHHRGHPFARRR